MKIENLIIEITRKCNLHCAHCLRGSAKVSKHLPEQYLKKLLEQCSYIGNVTFTGGEPSLNVKGIESFISLVKKFNITVGGFYIATNGVKISDAFVIACLQLYSLCEEKEMCSVELSNDIYHYESANANNDKPYNISALQGLSFFRKKYKEKEKYLPIAEGLWKHKKGRENHKITIPTTKEEFRDSEIYLNCKGEVIIGCDWSYMNQKSHYFCEVGELKEYYNNLKDE